MQTDLEGNKKPEKLTTESLNPTLIGAGKIPEEGIVITPYSIEKIPDGKFGEFCVLHAKMNDDGSSVDIAMSSQKLQRLITMNADKVIDHKIRLAGKGEKYEREYTIELL